MEGGSYKSWHSSSCRYGKLHKQQIRGSKVNGFFPRYVSIVKRYVSGGVVENDMDVVEQDEQEDARFVGEMKSLMCLCTSANITTAGFKENFWDFHDFTTN